MNKLKLCFTCLNCGKTSEKKKNTLGMYCNNQCQSDHKYKNYIRDWKLGIEIPKGMQLSKFIRTYLFEKFDYKCSQCEWSKTNPVSGKIPLEVDHIDGDHMNNSEENLRLLCPNCHSLTPNFRALNKGSGRADRMKRYHEGKKLLK